MKPFLSLAVALSAAVAQAQSATKPIQSTPPVGSNNSTTRPAANGTAYDYIVAGGGAAGIVVAQRLVESGKSVILLERGGTSAKITGSPDSVAWNSSVNAFDVPALFGAVDTKAYCTDTAGSAGCILGGGTVINALMFVRPQPADFNDRFPAGWKWDDVQAAAQRLYDRIPGTTTPSVDGKRYDQAAFDVLSQFFSSAGFKDVDTLANPGDKTDVFTHPPWMISQGVRSGPVRAYLPLATAQQNFKLQLNCKVLRAVRNDSTVTGVEVEMGDGTRQVIGLANPKEGKVILAAGTMSTPRILLNSGIGKPQQIVNAITASGFGLPASGALINSPVGQGVMDHPVFTLDFKVKGNATVTPVSAAALLKSPPDEEVKLYAQGSGLLAQSTQRLNFWTSVSGDKCGDGVQRFLQGTCSAGANNTVKLKIYLTHGLTSTGELGVNASTGATEWVTKPWMHTDGDKAAVREFLDRVIALSRQPGSNLELATANASGATLLGDFASGSHYVGSARMGTNRTTAVVDTNTKVFGTDNLFVVDASIHPDVPTGNTQAMVMVVAEAAADKILKLGNGTAQAFGPGRKCRRGVSRKRGVSQKMV